MSYLRAQFSLNDSSIGCSDIIEHEWLRLIEYDILIEQLY